MGLELIILLLRGKKSLESDQSVHLPKNFPLEILCSTTKKGSTICNPNWSTFNAKLAKMDMRIEEPFHCGIQL
jgi:hypothetical protein